MADWSEAYIKIVSEKNVLEKIEKEIRSLMDEWDYMAFLQGYPDKDYNGFQVSEIKSEGGNLIIIGSGRYSAPADFFEEQIFVKYGVSGIFEDRERGSDFFVQLEYDKGETISSINAPYFSKESVEAADEDMSYWIENYRDDFEQGGADWREWCKEDILVFNSVGISTEELEKTYRMQEKNILFIVGRSGTGKTTLANDLTDGTTYGYAPIKSLTSREVREEADAKWYTHMSKEELSKIPEYTLLERAEYGGELYATPKEIGEIEAQNLVKCITPDGLKDAKAKIERDYVNAKVAIVLMDIDQKIVVENLKNNGYDLDEIVQRITRGDEKASLYELGLKPDLVIKTLDENTTATVAEFMKEYFETQRAQSNEQEFTYERLRDMEEKKAPSITLAP